MTKKQITLLGIVAALVLAWFVLANTVLKGAHGTFHLSEGEWAQVAAWVEEGESDKFTAKLSDTQTIQVTYTGTYPMTALLTLSDAAGETAQYRLRMVEEHDSGTDSRSIVSDLDKVEP